MSIQFYSGLFSFKQVYRQLCEEERHLQDQSSTLNASMRGVLLKSLLRSFISDRHWNDLCHPPMIVSWIFLSDKAICV